MYGKDTLFALQIGAKVINETANASVTSDRLDATSDEAGYIFQMPKDMTVDQVGVLVDNLTGTPSYDVSIQGVDLTSGKPDGTIAGGGSPASTTWAPSADGFQWITLDNSLALSKNDLISIVVEDGSSGTDPDGSNYIDLVSQSIQIAVNQMPYLHISADTGSTWAATVNEYPIIALRNSGTTDDVIGRPIEVPYALISWTNGVGEIIAQKFKLPASLGRRVQVHGLQMHLSANNTDYDFGIFNASGGTVVATSQDEDTKVGISSQGALSFFAPTWLDTDTIYYAGLKQTSAGGNQFIYGYDCLTNDNLSAWPGYPDNNLSKYVSSWTDDTGVTAVGAALLVSGWDGARRVISV